MTPFKIARTWAMESSVGGRTIVRAFFGEQGTEELAFDDDDSLEEETREFELMLLEIRVTLSS